MPSVHQSIVSQIEKLSAGTILFPTDFRGTGSEDAIRKTLSRLTNENTIERLAHGIYQIPKIHPTFGKLHPSMEEIAEAVAAREHIRIRPAGAYALNKLGLSTQVPTKLVYITDGQARQINVGHGSIKFKSVPPKKFGMKGPVSSLLIQALEEIKESQLNSQLKMQICQLLKQESRENLMHDLRLAPARVNDLIINLLKEDGNEPVA